nr:urea ABC transporter permease subunit UrtB [Spirulina major]
MVDFIVQLLIGAFNGISIGSVLLISALGLAIVFGLMGVINLAHGELMMLGAYTTFFVQNLFNALGDPWAQVYTIAAIPAAFLVAALVGLILERGVIRFLYGRPLETLLATWGVSLILRQLVRTTISARNVDVTAPAWLRGGLQIDTGSAVPIQLPYARMFIIVLTIACVVGVYFFLNGSNWGLRIRSVTQNRQMSACLGIPTAKVDALTFAIGSGLAGIAGCAITLLGSVGPNTGQNYIIDTFMVVVVGGVGNLFGSIVSAMVIGIVTYLIGSGTFAVLLSPMDSMQPVVAFFEFFASSSMAKVMVFALIIGFLQIKPAGIFPQKGRTAEL